MALGLETVFNASLQCTGGAHGTLYTDPKTVFVEGMFAGVVTDAVPELNINVSGECLYIGSCIPMTALWVTGDPTVLIDGIPSLPQIAIAPCGVAMAADIVADAVGLEVADVDGVGVVMIMSPGNFTVFI